MFGKLFGKAKAKKEADAPQLAPAVREAVLNSLGQRSIPPMPSTAQQAYQLSTNPKAEARDFVEVIEADEALAARVLKVANSVFYDRGKPAKTVEEAVVVMGMNELRSLLSASSLTELFPSTNPLRTEFWRHDVAVAIVARTLANKVLPAQSELAFLGGLMHDLGKLLMLQRQPKEYGQVMEQVRLKGVPFCQAEEDVFVFNHTEVGQMIAEKWGFTPELIDVVRNHHRVLELKDVKPERNVTLLVAAADVLTHERQLGSERGIGALRQRLSVEKDRLSELLALPSGDLNQAMMEAERAFQTESEMYMS